MTFKTSIMLLTFLSEYHASTRRRCNAINYAILNRWQYNLPLLRRDLGVRIVQRVTETGHLEVESGLVVLEVGDLAGLLFHRLFSLLQSFLQHLHLREASTFNLVMEKQKRGRFERSESLVQQKICLHKNFKHRLGC